MAKLTAKQKAEALCKDYLIATFDIKVMTQTGTIVTILHGTIADVQRELDLDFETAVEVLKLSNQELLSQLV